MHWSCNRMRQFAVRKYAEAKLEKLQPLQSQVAPYHCANESSPANIWWLLGGKCFTPGGGSTELAEDAPN